MKHTAGKNLTSKSIVIPHVRTWWPASPVGYGVGAGGEGRCQWNFLAPSGEICTRRLPQRRGGGVGIFNIAHEDYVYGTDKDS